jgi:GNAT superfamily N-acetyltransferase
MRWELTENLEPYAAAALPFLLADPVTYTVHLTAVENDRRQLTPVTGESALYAVLRDGGGQVRGTASLTPPYDLLPSLLPPAASSGLVEALAERAVRLPGVVGPVEVAEELATCWARRVGLSVRRAMNERLYRLVEVTEPPLPPGRARLATVADEPLLVEWNRAFCQEAGVTAPPDIPRWVHQRVADARMAVWEDGAPVCLVGNQPVIGGVARVGPVYSPPQARRHGYASVLVAGVSRRLLADGADACVLFTDLGNPTSNSIYQQVGYRPVRDWARLTFN